MDQTDSTSVSCSIYDVLSRSMSILKEVVTTVFSHYTKNKSNNNVDLPLFMIVATITSF